jgi:hypothetical protein
LEPSECVEWICDSGSMMSPCSLACEEVEETRGKFGFMVPPPEDEVDEMPDEGLVLPLCE